MQPLETKNSGGVLVCMPDEMHSIERRDAEYLSLVNTPLHEDDNPDFGHWASTARFLRRLGAKSVNRLGPGLGAAFETFSIETQIYDTKTVVAMNSREKFVLSSEVRERQSFGILLFAQVYKGYERNPGPTKIAFGPVPDVMDEVELARRYASVLASLLEDYPTLLGFNKEDKSRVVDIVLGLLPPKV